MDEALVQDAEHDVDRHQGREDEKGLIGVGILKRLSDHLEAAADAARHAHVAHGAFDLRDGVS